MIARRSAEKTKTKKKRYGDGADDSPFIFYNLLVSFLGHHHQEMILIDALYRLSYATLCVRAYIL